MISFQLCVLAILVEWEVHSVTGHSPIYPCIACSIDSFVSRHSFMQDFIRFRCRSRRIDHLLRRAWIAFVIISWWLGVKSSAWTPSQKLKVKFLQRKRTGRKVYALKGVHKNIFLEFVQRPSSWTIMGIGMVPHWKNSFSGGVRP